MEVPQPKLKRMTVQEYLRFERASDVRHEFHDGEVVAPAGASIRHAVIVSNLAGQLSSQLHGRKCLPLGSDLRLWISRRRKFLYADQTIICGPIESAPEAPEEAATNPSVIFEILSASTEAYDRGAKFSLYRELSSLSEYVLISQDLPQVESFFRQPDGTWTLRTWTGLEAVALLPALGLTLALKDLFLNVDFDPLPTPV